MDDIHTQFDVVHEVPELENPLRDWRMRQAKEVMRDMAAPGLKSSPSPCVNSTLQTTAAADL